MARRQRIAALAAVTALSATACVNNDARPGEVRDAVEESGDLNREQAACVEQEFEDQFSQEQLNAIGGADQLGEIEPDLAAQVRTVLADCTGEEPTGPTIGEDDGTESDGTTTTEG